MAQSRTDRRRCNISSISVVVLISERCSIENPRVALAAHKRHDTDYGRGVHNYPAAASLTRYHSGDSYCTFCLWASVRSAVSALCRTYRYAAVFRPSSLAGLHFGSSALPVWLDCICNGLAPETGNNFGRVLVVCTQKVQFGPDRLQDSKRVAVHCRAAVRRNNVDYGQLMPATSGQRRSVASSSAKSPSRGGGRRGDARLGSARVCARRDSPYSIDGTT